MNIDIDKLIIEMEARKKSHSNQSLYETDPFKGEALSAKFHECDFWLQKLIALKKDESKQPQPPDCANTMLGEVPHGVNDQQEENLKAVEGAAPVVRQNEQLQKSCTHDELFKKDGKYTCIKCRLNYIPKFMVQDELLRPPTAL